ncbi:MAG: hypothetical protein WCK13_13070 [Ignavibacteriota bacterium]
MKTHFKIFAALMLIAVLFNLSFAQGNDDKVILCDNYDTLYSMINKGIPASMYKSATIEGFTLVEKSMITVYPKVSEGYLVEMQIIKITQGENFGKYESNAVLGFFASGCKEFKKNFSRFNKTSCRFYADSPEDAMDAARNGISVTIESKYILEGTLVDTYKKICFSDAPDPMPVKKPAVYLYPTEQMNVSVKVNVNGKLTYTDPAYGTGWNVNATADGMIDNKYDYLFYEADLNKVELPNEGWVVEYGNLKEWFEEYLPKLGLNKKEKEQFEEYWLAKLRKAKYYDIRILGDKFLAENMELLIEPKPETLLRLNFYFKPLSSKTELTAPEIKGVTRKGFTVVEWGGVDGGELRIVL